VNDRAWGKGGGRKVVQDGGQGGKTGRGQGEGAGGKVIGQEQR